MEELIGRKIKRIFVENDQCVLYFETDSTDWGIMAYPVYSECCSETWFADIIGTSALIGGTVTNVETVDMKGYNVDDGRTRQDVDEAYGYRIFTDKGQADIIFRNSSNGFYGGELRPVELYVQIPESVKEITGDWSA